MRRPARDPDLLDLIDALPKESYKGTAWRVVREGREPLQLSRIAGRWNMDDTEALYTSLDANGAVAEINYRLSLEPVFPSRYRAQLHELTIEIDNIVRFSDLASLVPLGIDVTQYQTFLYDRTQELGDAIQFLGINGLIAPSARWSCLNLVAYNLNLDRVIVGTPRPINWEKWRTETRLIRRSPTS